MYAMSKIYAKKVLAGQMTIDEVPEKYRKEVEEIINPNKEVEING